MGIWCVKMERMNAWVHEGRERREDHGDIYIYMYIKIERG